MNIFVTNTGNWVKFLSAPTLSKCTMKEFVNLRVCRNQDISGLMVKRRSCCDWCEQNMKWQPRGRVNCFFLLEILDRTKRFATSKVPKASSAKKIYRKHSKPIEGWNLPSTWALVMIMLTLLITWTRCDRPGASTSHSVLTREAILPGYRNRVLVKPRLLDDLHSATRHHCGKVTRTSRSRGSIFSAGFCCEESLLVPKRERKSLMSCRTSFSGGLHEQPWCHVLPCANRKTIISCCRVWTRTRVSQLYQAPPSIWTGRVGSNSMSNSCGNKTVK